MEIELDGQAASLVYTSLLDVDNITTSLPVTLLSIYTRFLEDWLKQRMNDHILRTDLD